MKEPSASFIYPDLLPKELKELVAERAEERMRDELYRVVCFIVREILDHANPAMTAAAIGFACGLPLLEGASEVELAKRFGVTKQAFSRRVTNLGKGLALSPSRAMRSEKARETFHTIQKCKPKTKLQSALLSLN